MRTFFGGVKSVQDILECAEEPVGGKKMEDTCHLINLYLNGRAR